VKIVNVEEMRQIEQATDAGGQSYAAMMDMAGRSVAETAVQLVLSEEGKSVLVLVGPGNNGGDGLVAARYLLEAGQNVCVYVWRRNVKGDENFQRLKRRRRGVSILWANNDDGFSNLREELKQVDLIVDALLGTGAARPIEGQLAELMHVVWAEVMSRRAGLQEPGMPEELMIMPRFPLAESFSLGVKLSEGARRDAALDDLSDDDFFDDDDVDDTDLDAELDPAGFSPSDALPDDWDDDDWDDDEDVIRPRWPVPTILAVDCPSGLNCDTGEVDPSTFPADLTLTFGFVKWGQVQYPGAGLCGMLGVAGIGVRPELADALRTELAGPSDIREWLPVRPMNANKGTFGKVMVVAGSLNFTGAAYLSGAAATRTGAGLVTLAIPAPLHPILASALHETTWLLSPGTEGVHSAAALPALLAALEGYDALLVGPGLTTMPPTAEFVERLFGPEGLSREAWAGKLVVDADALNTLAKLEDWPSRLPPLAILTPHPGEMARLTGMAIDEINRQRIATARQWAAAWGHVVLLKGAHTVVAAPDGRVTVLPFANPGLATAGSGDVLAGAIVAMLAQGLPAFEAAVCGAYTHGHAGLLLLRSNLAAGVVAGDLLPRLPEALSQLYQA
jgi:ADP-dependent NAD(P)H-hydrate dehydratase / NAD(P)H-hydrate epimerase